VHQVGFSLHDYIDMHGQQNVKFKDKHQLQFKFSIIESPHSLRLRVTSPAVGELSATSVTGEAGCVKR